LREGRWPRANEVAAEGASVERATKYGVLFIVLAFLSFFLFEVMASARIHPFQ
jgi:inner membrane protein involved in colicin E2 resistance